MKKTSKSSSGEALSKTIYSSLFADRLTKGDLRKIEILEATIKTFDQLDIEYVSFEDIARSAKLSRPLVQHHFPDKRELFKTTIKFIRAKMQISAVDALNKFSSPTDKLVAYIGASFKWAKDNPSHMHMWLYLFFQCMGNQELRSLHSEMTSMGRERIVDLLSLGIDAREFKVKDKVTTAVQIQQLITGGLVEYTAEDSRPFSVLLHDTTELCLKVVGAKA